MKKIIILFLIACLAQAKATAQTCNVQDSLELVSINTALGGANWTTKWTGLVSTWTGVSLYTSGTNIGKVKELTLQTNNLIGTLPSFNLPNLTSLNIYNNTGLTGNIPNFVLPNLTSLYIGYNTGLTGNIPNFVLPNLTSLYIWYNTGLTGNIPNFVLPNLTYLYLGSNKLSGNVPNVTFATNPYNYGIQGNKFTFGNILNAWTALNNSSTQHGYGYAPQDTLLPLTFNNGTLTADLAGASLADLTYTWYRNGVQVGNPIVGNNTFTPTQSGTYTFKVTHATITQPSVSDRNLILNSQSKVFTACSPYTISATTSLATCASNGLGSIALSTTAGTIASYNWATATTTGSGTGATINNVAAGTYSITATDANGCTATASNIVLDHADHQELVNWYNNNNGATWNVNWGATLNVPRMTGWTGITTNGNGCVTEINLYQKNIVGSIPNFNLKDLENLHLGANQLTGNIPSLSSTNLKNIALYGNQLSGTIPNFNLSGLKILSLSGNLLTGPIPPFNFLNLEELALNDNQLTGEIPAFAFSNLKFISVENNKLKGIVPNLNYASTFQGLRFRKNLFNFGSLKNLTQLSHTNTWYSEQDTLLPISYANGILTADLGGATLADLTYTWYRNGVQIGSPITGNNTITPTVSGTYTFSVTHAVITQPNVANRNLILNSQSKVFTACAPYTINTTPTIATCANNGLGSIALSTTAGTIASYNWANAITTGSGTGTTVASAPAGIYQITATLSNGCTSVASNVVLDHADHQQLVSWYNSNNGSTWSVNWGATLNDPTMTGWTGIFTNIYGCVSNITLYQKNITGSIPDFSLRDLENLHLGANQLTGNIPSLSSTSLKNLALYENQLSGTIPNFNLSGLKVLSLSYNQLTDTIPNFNLPSLLQLHLHNNQFSGKIPDFNKSQNLIDFHLANNQLTGSIPNFNLPALVAISLDNNQLSGSIPRFNYTNLRYLSLSNNQLSDTIPNFNLALTHLFLFRNQLSGKIPSFSLTNLQNIWLQENQLSGSIPNFNLPNLKALYLDSNQLSGKIPDFNLVTNLQNLSFYYNLFNFGSFQNWSYLSSNIPGYAPQNTQLPVAIFSNGILTADLAGMPDASQLTYTWYKNGVQIGNPIVGNNTFMPTQSGAYTFSVTHATITQPNVANRNLILNSQSKVFTACAPYTINTTPTVATCANNGLGSIALSITAGTIASYNWATATTTGNGTGATINNVAAGTYSFTATDVNGCTATTSNIVLDHADHQQLVSWYNSNNGSTWNVNWGATLNDPRMTGWTGITTNTKGCVTKIELDQKNISGTIPNFNLPNLLTIFLQGNSGVVGSIPSFSYLQSLEELTISNNPNITGILPNFNLPSLKKLDIRHTQITDTIPNFTNLLNLQSLYFESNGLTGKIPNFTHLQNLKSLSINDMDGITDTIPNFTHLINLDDLSIRSMDGIIGKIPNFTNIPSLYSLDIRRNINLSGTLPNFTNFPNLRFLQIWRNPGIVGVIPQYNLSKLNTIILEDNGLDGNIPNIIFVSNTYDFSVLGNKFNFGNINNAWTAINNASYQNGLSGYAPQNTILPAPAVNGYTLTADLAGMPDASQLTYTWYNNGVQVGSPIVGNNTYTPTVSGTYTFSVTHATITQPNVATRNLILNSQSVNFNACNLTSTLQNQNNILTPTPSNGTAPYSYAWSNGATSASISATASGTYSVTVTDANSCTASASILSCQPNVLISHANLPGTTEVSYQITPPTGANYSAYTWYYAGNQIGTGLTATYDFGQAGTYTVSVEINVGNGCPLQTVSQTITIACSLSNVAITPQTATTVCTGTNVPLSAASAGGVFPLTYAWSNGTTGTSTNVTSATAGIFAYSVTVTDALGCTKQKSIAITYRAAPIAVITGGTPILCHGANTGAINVTVSGGTSPYTYTWSNGATTTNVSNLTAGFYSMTTTDANGCSATAANTMTAPSAVTITLTASHVTCNGGTNGAISLLANGGISPYTYLWSNGMTTKDISDLKAGKYFVTLTDANNCKTIRSIIVTAPSALDVNIDNLASNDDWTAIATGGTAPYTYLWSNGATTATISHRIIPAGNYTVTVTDSKGCSKSTTIGNCDPNVNITHTPDSLAVVTLIATAPIGANYPNFSWYEGGNFLGTGNPLTYNFAYAGKHEVYCVVTMPNSPCSPQKDSLPYELNIGCKNIGVTINATAPACVGAPVTLSANASGGHGLYHYAWSHTSLDTATTTATSLVAGQVVYILSITDRIGCDADTMLIVNYLPSPSAVTTVIDVACHGENTGTANAVATGGTSPYSYKWTNGQTNPLISNLFAGAYTVTVSDVNGCAATTTATISEPTALSVTTTQLNVLCHGGSNGSAALSITGGTAPYTYLWSYLWPNGATTSSISGLISGTYNATITDANNCKIYASVTITQPDALSLSVNKIYVLCNGGNTGSVTVTATGGTFPYTYAWSNGGGADSTTGLTADIYDVTVTDANNCTAQISVTITEPTALSVTITQANVLCYNGANGSATANPTGGTAPYTYLWSNSATTANISSLFAGTYDVTVTDANGCIITTSVTITEPTVLSVTTTQINVSCNAGNNASATVVPTGGAAPYTYLWSNGATTDSISNLLAATYNTTITDYNGCIITTSVTITEPGPLNIFTIQTDVSCHGGNNGTANVVWVGGVFPYTAVWSNGATTALISNLVVGRYYLTVTDGNGCVAITVQAVYEPTALSISTTQSDVSCNGGSNGYATVTPNGGTAPYTYLWSNSATTANINNLISGTYKVTITDANDCIVQNSVTITEPALLSFTIIQGDVSCNGGSNGYITVTPNGGIAPYTYLWNNGETTTAVTGLVAGYHRVTVTDMNSCFNVITITVAEPAALSVTTTQSNVFCHGGNSGTAEATATGGTAPYTYAWSNGETTATISGLIAGIYQVTVTDMNGCMVQDSVTITEPTVLRVTAKQTNVLCHGGNSGTAEATATGGTAPYTYAWSNGETTATISGLLAGSYQVTVTDANGCKAYDSATITEPQILAVSVFPTPISCNGANNGTAEANATGGTTPYTYAWSNGGTGIYLFDLKAGFYTVTITDKNGCTTSSSVTITEPTVLSLNINKKDVLCKDGKDGSITVTPTGGTTPYTYKWLSGATTATISGLESGTYSVTVTDAKGCTKGDSIVITYQTSVNAVITVVTPILCHGGKTGAIGVMVSDGTSPYTYLWSSGATTRNVTGIAAGIHSLTATDANGCTVTATNTMTTPSAVTIKPTASHVTCNGNDDGAINTLSNGGISPYTYTWSNGKTTEDLSKLVAGTYTVTVTDKNQCTAIDSVVITQPTKITLAKSQINVNCNSTTSGKAIVTATGGKASYTYLWSNGATTSSISGLSQGTYRVTVTDANGCFDTTSVSVINTSIPFTIQPLVYSGTIASCTAPTINADLTCNVTNGTNLSYQWQKSLSGSNYTNIGNGTNTLHIDSPGYYRCKVSNNCVNRNSTVFIASGTPTISVATDFCVNHILTAVSNISSGVIYQWQKNANTTTSCTPFPTWVNIIGATSATYKPTTVGIYRVVATVPNCSLPIASAPKCINLTNCPTAISLVSIKEELQKYLETLDFTNYQPEFIDPNEVFPTISIDENGIETIINKPLGTSPTLDIAPNPTRDVLHLNFSLVENGMTQLSIIDIRGIRKTIWRAQKVAGDYVESLDDAVSELSSGLYFIELATPTAVITKKIVKID